MIARELIVMVFVLPQIDDQRRTHNYDEFICTFISMLAQEGKNRALMFCNMLSLVFSESK